MIKEQEIIDLIRINIFAVIEYRFGKTIKLEKLVTEKSIKLTAKAIMDKIEKEENDLSYEKDCPEAFGFDNYGSNNG